MSIKTSGLKNKDSYEKVIFSLYNEAQQWARHYEFLIVQTSIFIISISLGFLSYSFSSKDGDSIIKLSSILISFFLTILGFLIIRMLFSLYKTTIERMIDYESILGCYDPDFANEIGFSRKTLLPENLKITPIEESPVFRFFKNIFYFLMTIIPIAIFYVLIFDYFE